MISSKKMRIHNKQRGMTLLEILIVVSLISIISIVLFSSLATGLRVWERSRRSLIEQDIVIFLDKISQDIRNSFIYSLIPFQGGEDRLSFPTIVYIPADPYSGLSEGTYVDQIGKVEYYFEILDKGLYRRAANYSQAISDLYGTPRKLVEIIDQLKFHYYYLSEKGELYSRATLEGVPLGVEISVVFSDSLGERVMRKYIDVPLGS